MKAIPFLLALTTVPAFIAQAADNAGAMEGYFPTDGTVKPGVHVQTVFGKGFRAQLEKLSEAVKKLPEEKRAAYLQGISWDKQPAYNADIWPNKADYNELVAEWRKAELKPLRIVGVGLSPLGNGLWRVLSTTEDPQTKRSVPLTISSLRYDANRNMWLSGNGELTAKDYSVPETSIYGAQTGTEWSLEKSDSFSHMSETIRVTKTTDGKYVYLAYSFVERSVATGANIASGAYLLQFPVRSAGAKLGTPGQR